MLDKKEFEIALRAGDEAYENQWSEGGVRFLSSESNNANFPWKIVIHTEENGRKISYALSQDAHGKISWNKITYLAWTDTVWAVYQLHEDDIRELKDQKLLDHFQDALRKSEREHLDSVKQQLMRLFIDGERYNPFWGRYPEGLDLREFRGIIGGLSETTQRELAQYFFDQTIGEHISNNWKAYMVYGLLKGTTFGQEFQRRENERLIDAGSWPFIL